MLDRRGFVGGALAAGVASRAEALTPLPPPPEVEAFHSALDLLELKSGGRLGVAYELCPALGDNRIDFQTGLGQPTGNGRFRERFAFCSAFKFSLAALILAGGASGEWRLWQNIEFSEADILPASPVTSAMLKKVEVPIGQWLDEGHHINEDPVRKVKTGKASLVELAKAAQQFSDNTAANLLLRHIGGLQRLNAFWGALGADSRIDNFEPELNRVPAGSLHNTTTPEAMAHALVGIFTKVLSPLRASQLKRWMHDTTTGKNRLRAGLPADWWAGDKTGTGLPSDIPGTYVDLAWVEPPNLPAFAIAAFYQPAKPTPDGDPSAEAVLAQVGRIVAERVMAQARSASRVAKP